MSYFGVTVEGIPSVDRVLDVMAKAGKQLPFAISLALNRTADEVVRHAREELFPQKLTLRTAWASKGPFKVKRDSATKTKLSVTVGSSAPWLKMQEEGGTKKPHKKALAIPIRTSLGIIHTKIIPTSKKPGLLLKNPRTFIQSIENGTVGIFQRKGKSRYPIKMMYNLEHSANIRPILDFVRTEEEQVKKVYQKMFGEALGYALKTAK